jgi:hypothetical protein
MFYLANESLQVIHEELLGLEAGIVHQNPGNIFMLKELAFQ